MIYVNKIENRTMFKIKTGYYLELLTPETITLLGSAKSKITKDENRENVPYLKITEVVIIHVISLRERFKSQESCIHLFLISHLVNY